MINILKIPNITKLFLEIYIVILFFPDFLSIIFDLGHEFNFTELFNNYKIISSRNKIFNLEYNLCWIICCLTTAHYSSEIINYPYDNQELNINEFYYNDDLIIPNILKNYNFLKK